MVLTLELIVLILVNYIGTSSRSLASRAADEACEMAKEAGFSEFEAMLTTGGDCRSLIDVHTGKNKYHIRPQPIDPEHVFRGSCTGNPPTKRGYDAAEKLFESAFKGRNGDETSEALTQVFEDQRNRIASLLNLPEGAEVILCPSGSDAEYIPLAIAKALRPDATIANGSTQIKEVGAGSAPAAAGRYFSTHAPLLGKVDKEKTYLTGFESIEGITIAARDHTGKVLDAAGEMKKFTEDSLKQGFYPIVHGVFGGKTGVRDTVMPPSMDAGDTSLGIVDACQGRFTTDELMEWLDQDSLVLFTGSKFYQGPPFCGAVIVPPRIAEKLRTARAPTQMFTTDGLGGFMTEKELPSCLRKWAPYMMKKDTNNVGLALRWEASLAGMQALAHVSDEERTEAADEWASGVVKHVRSEANLDAWCVERSIVSIRVAKEDGWLSVEELRDLFRWIGSDVSEKISGLSPEEKAILSKPAYIGQPVDVSEAFGIVRIALGVDSMLSYMDNKESTLAGDLHVVKKLATIGKHFKALKQSESVDKEEPMPKQQNWLVINNSNITMSNSLDSLEGIDAGRSL